MVLKLVRSSRQQTQLTVIIDGISKAARTRCFTAVKMSDGVSRPTSQCDTFEIYHSEHRSAHVVMMSSDSSRTLATAFHQQNNSGPFLPKQASLRVFSHLFWQSTKVRLIILIAGIPRRRHGHRHRHRHRLAKHGYNLTSDTRYFLASQAFI